MLTPNRLPELCARSASGGGGSDLGPDIWPPGGAGVRHALIGLVSPATDFSDAPPQLLHLPLQVLLIAQQGGNFFIVVYKSC